jgi:hypothetical protein
VVVALVVLGGIRSEDETTAKEPFKPTEIHQVTFKGQVERFFSELLSRQAYADPLATVLSSIASKDATQPYEVPWVDVKPPELLAPEPAEPPASASAEAPATLQAEVAPPQATAPPPTPSPPIPEPTTPPQPAPAPPVLQEAAPSAPSGTTYHGQATHYGPSFNGQPLGCGNGVYSSHDPSIVAVSPARYAEWPCGTQLQVCGPGGCVVATRQDACPGCHPNVVDLSEAANSIVCGGQPHTCSVTI